MLVRQNTVLQTLEGVYYQPQPVQPVFPHWNTFSNKMSPFSIRRKVLNHFASKIRGY